MRCELRGHGEDGWKVQTFRDREFSYGPRFVLRENAEREAADLRRDLEADGGHEARPTGRMLGHIILQLRMYSAR